MACLWLPFHCPFFTVPEGITIFLFMRCTLQVLV